MVTAAAGCAGTLRTTTPSDHLDYHFTISRTPTIREPDQLARAAGIQTWINAVNKSGNMKLYRRRAV